MAATKERDFKSFYLQRYLIVFAQEHVNFRLEEFQSICSLFDISIDERSLKHRIESPFVVIVLKNDREAIQIASRSILIKSIFKLYACEETLEQLIGILKQYQADDILAPSRKDDSYKINVDCFNKKLSHERKLKYIEGPIRDFVYKWLVNSNMNLRTSQRSSEHLDEKSAEIDYLKNIFKQSLSFLPCVGEVDLRNPGTIFSLILDHSTRTQGSDDPARLFFGRLVSNGQRHLIKHYSLKTRHFIGNTSMDAQLALLMANMAKCKDGIFVYDPFVGTGSILVACSHFGAHSSGSDIDRTLLLGRGHPSRAEAGKWREKDESVKSNFKMYNLHDRYIDVWMGDQMNTSLRRRPLFDAIVTDPPYGIREGSRQLAKAPGPEVNQVIDGFKLPATQRCLLSDAIYNLLEFAVMYLVLHGRLVFWLPTHKSNSGYQNIPLHPCMQFLHRSEQGLSTNVSRQLITMEKIREPQEGDIVSIDEHAREIYNQFRNQYFKTSDVG